MELERFADLNYTRMFGEIAIDLVCFDDFLHTIDNYEDRGLSMEEFVIERYGNQAAQVIRDLLPQKTKNE